MSINKNYGTLDLRIRRTHKLLFDALSVLLTKKSFEDIRISDICDNAMIHRTTFYKHFEDKYHLLDSLLRHMVADFKEKSIDTSPDINSREYYINLLRLLLEHMYENKKLYSVGLLNNNSTTTLLKKIVLERIKTGLEITSANGIEFSVPIPIISEFYSSAIVNLARWWLENGTPISIDEIVKHGNTLIADLAVNKTS